jgi:copper chaperone CopZ
MFYKFRPAALPIILLMALNATTAFAQDYVIHVNGMVCEFCSLGVTKKVSKLPFIDKEKYNKGVKVEIENQRVTIAVKESAELDRDALFEAIESGGYNPVEIFKLASNGELTAYRK